MLQKHCPKLKSVHITDDAQCAFSPLQDLDKLTSLRELSIDLDLLVSFEDWSAIPGPGLLLPPNLSTLRVTHIDYEELHSLLAPHTIVLQGRDSPFHGIIKEIFLGKPVDKPRLMESFNQYKSVPLELASTIEASQRILKGSTIKQINLEVVTERDSAMDALLTLLLGIIAVRLYDEAGVCHQVDFRYGVEAVRSILDNDGIHAFNKAEPM